MNAILTKMLGSPSKVARAESLDGVVTQQAFLQLKTSPEVKKLKTLDSIQHDQEFGKVLILTRLEFEQNFDWLGFLYRKETERIIIICDAVSDSDALVKRIEATQIGMVHAQEELILWALCDTSFSLKPFALKPSLIDGYGLFTKNEIQKGTLLIRIEGERVDLNELKTSPSKEWNAPHGKAFAITKRRQTAYYFINHSESNNVSFTWVGEDYFLRADRNLKAEEELLSNYKNEDLPESYFLINSDWISHD